MQISWAGLTSRIGRTAKASPSPRIQALRPADEQQRARLQAAMDRTGIESFHACGRHGVMTDECVDEIIQILDDLAEDSITKPDPHPAG